MLLLSRHSCLSLSLDAFDRPRSSSSFGSLAAYQPTTAARRHRSGSQQSSRSSDVRYAPYERPFIPAEMGANHRLLVDSARIAVQVRRRPKRPTFRPRKNEDVFPLQLSLARANTNNHPQRPGATDPARHSKLSTACLQSAPAFSSPPTFTTPTRSNTNGFGRQYHRPYPSFSARPPAAKSPADSPQATPSPPPAIATPSPTRLAAHIYLSDGSPPPRIQNRRSRLCRLLAMLDINDDSSQPAASASQGGDRQAYWPPRLSLGPKPPSPLPSQPSRSSSRTPTSTNGRGGLRHQQHRRCAADWRSLLDEQHGTSSAPMLS